MKHGVNHFQVSIHLNFFYYWINITIDSILVMIKQLSEKKQVILSTFHPELCEQADKLFGILNQEGVMFNS